MSKIFISYSRKDLDTAERILSALAINDLDPWVDWKSIPKGEEFEREIQQGIEEAEVILFLVSPDSVQSVWCKKEIAHAVTNGKRILPIVIRDTDIELIPAEIAKRNWIFCRPNKDEFDKTILETYNTIQTDYEWLKYHTQLQVKALEWERTKDTSRLLRGKELREAEEKISQAGSEKDPQPTNLHRLFLLNSRKYEEKQHRRYTTGLGIGFVIVTILAFFAWQQRNFAVTETMEKSTALVNEENAKSTAEAETYFRATEQAKAEERARQLQARNLASMALDFSESNAELALLMSRTAIEIENNIITEESLLSALNYCRDGFSVLPGHKGKIIDMDFSPDGNQMVTIGEDRVIIFWDSNTGEQLDILTLPPSYNDMVGRPSTITFHPNGKMLASSISNGEIYFWDVVTKEQTLPKIETFSNIYQLEFSKNGAFLILETSDSIQIWDYQKAEMSLEIQPASGQYAKFSYSFGGDFLAYEITQDVVQIWDLEKNVQAFELSFLSDAKTFGNLYDLSFNSDGELLAISTSDGIFIWDVINNRQIGEPIDEANNFTAPKVFFSPDNKMLLVFAFSVINVWDLETRTLLSSKNFLIADELIFHPSSEIIAVNDNDTVRLWNINSWEQVGKTLSQFLVEDISDQFSVAIGPENKILVTAGNVLSVWDTSSGNLLNDRIKTLPAFWKTSLSSNGVVFGGWGCIELIKDEILGDVCEQEGVVLLDTLTGEEITVMPLDLIYVSTVALNSNANLLAMAICEEEGEGWIAPCARSKVVVWDMVAKEIIFEFPSIPDTVYDLIFDHKDKTLAAAICSERYQGGYCTKMDVMLWDLLSAESIGNVEGLINQLSSYPSTSMAFSMDDSKLAMAGCVEMYGSTVCTVSKVFIWDTRQQQLLGNSIVNTYGVISDLIYHPGGELLISANSAGLYLWNEKTGEQVGESLIWYEDFTNQLTLSADGKMLAAVSGEKIFLIELDPIALQNRACECAGRNFTQAEWQQYFPGEEYRVTCPQWPAGPQNMTTSTPE